MRSKSAKQSAQLFYCRAVDLIYYVGKWTLEVIYLVYSVYCTKVCSVDL